MLSILEKDKDITHFSNFRTPASAQFFYELKSERDVDNLFEIYEYARHHDMKILLIGGGTNMLFAFDDFKGIVIKNSLSGWSYDKEGHILEAYSNDMIWEIAQSLEDDYGQKLWHRFIGLPGSIGGAVFGNAGCFGLETENNFTEAKVIDTWTGETCVFTKNQMSFGYRTSFLKQNEGRYFLIKAQFDLSKKIEKYHSDVDNIDFRENKQPKGNSCGSFFKNPDKNQSAGSLIEEVGLKGVRHGGAFFSEKHANFLLHDGAGTWQDLIFLIEQAQSKVKAKFGIDLVNEVRIIQS